MSSRRLPRSPNRVDSRPSALQQALRETLRSADRVRRIGQCQSQKMRDVLRGQSYPALTLEALLDELIVCGTPDDDVLALVACIETDVRAKLSARRGDAVPGFIEAHCAEMATEGEANQAQVIACADRSPSALRRLLDRLSRHRAALASLALSARAELAHAESRRSW